MDCSGHSLGGALASLMAHNLAHKYPTLAKDNRLHMYSFGAPRVGNTQVGCGAAASWLGGKGGVCGRGGL